jgi:lactate permease
MLALSRLMVHSGMIAALAEAAAGSRGAAWPARSRRGRARHLHHRLGHGVQHPVHRVPALGRRRGCAAALAMVAAQGFGSAIGNVIAPHNIIAGSATVGLVGREGECCASTAAAGLLYTAGAGALIYADAYGILTRRSPLARGPILG